MALLAIALATVAVAAADPSATTAAKKRVTGRCMGLKPTIAGTSGPDRLVGTARRDVILAGDGNDTILGGGGNDVICAGGGADRVDGGAGNDTVAGGPGADTVAGGDGDDTLGGGHGADSVAGGAGTDRLYGSAGNDDLSPGTGQDLIFGGPGADTIEPGDGSSAITPDPIVGQTDPGDPSNSRGADVTIPDQSALQLLGSDADRRDLLPPAAWNDRVDPGPGNDAVVASPGDDTVMPSAGDDRIGGGAGNDNLQGGDGTDIIDGGAQRDTIDGGPGADTLSGGDGGDSVKGGPNDASDGSDTIDGGASVDDISGGAGADTLQGGGGADVVFGGPGNDAIQTGAGFDTAYGDAGTDSCADSEQPFTCETTGGTSDTALNPDAPAPSGICDAWAASSGDDQAAGTMDRPYRTAERLANALRPGETGCLQPGETFQEPDFELHVRGGGQPGNPITIRTAPAGPRATVKGRVWIDAAAHDIRFEDLNFDGQNPLAVLRGVGAALPSPTVDGDRIAFHAVDVTTSGTATCFVIGSVLGYGIAEDVSITGSRIHDCGVVPRPDQPSGDHGVDLESSRRAVVAHNFIYDNADKGILVYPDAQDSRISDNVLNANRINIHFGTAVAPPGWIFPPGSEVLPQNNPVTNNVISNSRLGLSDPDHWEVEGIEDGTTTHPTGNLVDGNCFFHAGDATRDIQPGNHAFDAGASNLAGASQPPAGPGYVSEPTKDFRLTGGPGQCPRSYGPEDLPDVTTLALTPFTQPPGFTITDRSRTSGSTVWVEFRGGAGVARSEPVAVGPGQTTSARVPLPDLTGVVQYRAVARSAGGLAYGALLSADLTKPTAGPPRAPDPVLAQSVNLVKPSSRGVKARLQGLDLFHAFNLYAQVPVGTDVDARRGSLDVQTIGRDGTRGVATVSGGLFAVLQQRGAGDPTTLVLSEMARCGGARPGLKAAASRVNRLYARWRHRRGRRLNVRGHYANGSALGTRFSVADRCDGTMVQVFQGTVLVRDFAKRRTIRVRARHRYLARKPARR